MLLIKPDLKVLTADAVVKPYATGNVHFGSSCNSMSPKFHELLARCEVARGIEPPDTGSAVRPPGAG